MEAGAILDLWASLGDVLRIKIIELSCLIIRRPFPFGFWFIFVDANIITRIPIHSDSVGVNPVCSFESSLILNVFFVMSECKTKRGLVSFKTYVIFVHMLWYYSSNIFILHQFLFLFRFICQIFHVIASTGLFFYYSKGQTIKDILQLI